MLKYILDRCLNSFNNDLDRSFITYHQYIFGEQNLSEHNPKQNDLSTTKVKKK